MTFNNSQAIFLVGYIFISYYLFTIRYQIVNFKEPVVGLLFGIFMLSVAVSYDLIVYGWGNNIIINHLLLSRDDPWSIFLIVAFSYVLILYGLEAIIIILIKKLRKTKS